MIIWIKIFVFLAVAIFIGTPITIAIMKIKRDM